MRPLRPRVRLCDANPRRPKPDCSPLSVQAIAFGRQGAVRWVPDAAPAGERVESEGAARPSWQLNACLLASPPSLLRSASCRSAADAWLCRSRRGQAARRRTTQSTRRSARCTRASTSCRRSSRRCAGLSRRRWRAPPAARAASRSHESGRKAGLLWFQLANARFMPGSSSAAAPGFLTTFGALCENCAQNSAPKVVGNAVPVTEDRGLAPIGHTACLG